jgi:DNA invertase Pin-like site-specific DNA recombinase
MGMRIGYLRVSSDTQNLERQDLGEVEKLFSEKVSGATAKDRPQLTAMMDFAREGDEVICYSIDRLARDLRDCLHIVTTLNGKGVTVTFLSERLTFSSKDDDPFARLQLHLMSAFAEFERSIIRRRQREGIDKAKQRGVYKGRPPSIDAGKVLELREAGLGPSDIARDLGISRASVYRLMKG